MSVDYMTISSNQPNAAVPGVDYQSVQGTLTFGPGETEKFIEVPIIDNLEQGTKVVRMRFSNPTGGLIILNDIVDGLLLDYDSGPSEVSISSVQMYRGIGEPRTMRFDVTLGKHQNYPVRVRATTQDFIAIAGRDYEAKTEVVTIPAGQKTGSFYVMVYGTTTPGPDIAFLVNLSNANLPIALAGGSAFGTLRYGEPLTTASFVGADAATRGNWKGRYGKDGYNIIGDGMSYLLYLKWWRSKMPRFGDAISYPLYAQVNVANQSFYTWAGSTDDARALQKATNASDRVAASWITNPNPFTIEVNISDTQEHQVALYILDWDNANGGRTGKIEVIKAANNQVLDTQTVTSFQNGKYIIWNIRGHVVFRMSNLGDPAVSNMTVSGLFFGVN
jgi:hypothetical protein